MSLADAIENDLGGVFDTGELAREALYTPGDGGDPVTIPVILSHGENLADERLGMAVAAQATAYVRSSDVARPAVHDQMELGGETWTVEQILRGNGHVWTLAVRRDLRLTLRR